MVSATESASRILDESVLRTMIELGKFCGVAASESSEKAVHSAFLKFVGAVERNFRREEEALADGGRPSPLHAGLHGLILQELNELGDALNAKGVTLERDQLLRLRRLIVAEGELEGILADHLRRHD